MQSTAKWLKRFDGLMAWKGSAFDQWERSKKRKQQNRKRKQMSQIGKAMK